MPERLTHQALPALSCFVDLLGPSHGPPWGSLLRELPLFLSAALGEQQALQWPWARPRHSPVVQTVAGRLGCSSRVLPHATSSAFSGRSP